MRLTLRTDLAMRVLMFCATHPGQLHRSADIARACKASANHLMQVVPVLHRQGYVRATRGRAGGVELAAPPEQVTVGEVFRLFEAGLPFAECFTESEDPCPLTLSCLLRPAMEQALEAFYATLDKITVADLVAGNTGLQVAFATGLTGGAGGVCPEPGRIRPGAAG